MPAPLFPDPSGLAPADFLAAFDATARLHETPCGDGRMVWRAFGEGPPLVLLHGGYGSWMHWIRTIPAFAGARTVWTPDMPGLGDSDEAPEPSAPETIAAVVAQGLDALGLERGETDLVGFSFGALIGGHVAALAPGLRSLTLVGAGGLGTHRNPIVLARTDGEMDPRERRELHRQNLGLLMIADPARIDDLAVTIQEVCVPRARVKSRRFSKTASLADVLGQSGARMVHAVWGDRDAVAAPHFEERRAVIASLRPDATFTLLPDAGHWAAYETPDAFNALLRALLARAPD